MFIFNLPFVMSYFTESCWSDEPQDQPTITVRIDTTATDRYRIAFSSDGTLATVTDKTSIHVYQRDLSTNEFTLLTTTTELLNAQTIVEMVIVDDKHLYCIIDPDGWNNNNVFKHFEWVADESKWTWGSSYSHTVYPQSIVCALPFLVRNVRFSDQREREKARFCCTRVPRYITWCFLLPPSIGDCMFSCVFLQNLKPHSFIRWLPRTVRTYTWRKAIGPN